MSEEEQDAKVVKQLIAARKHNVRHPSGVWAATGYDPLLADEVCERIANGESLAAICRDPGMPTPATMYAWMKQNPEFADLYRFAVNLSGLTHADSLIDLADGILDGSITPAQAYPVINIKQWLGERRAPQFYSSKAQVEVTDKTEHAAPTDDRDFARRVAFSLAKGVYGDGERTG